MRLPVIVSLSICASLVAVGAAADNAFPLGFDQAVERTLLHAPELERSAARIAEADAARKQARGNLMPSLHGVLSASRSNNPLNVFGAKLSQGQADFGDFGADEFNPADPGVLSIRPDGLNSPDAHNNFGSQLEVDIPVYNGGKVRGLVKTAGYFLKAARQGDRYAHQQVLFAVLKSYEGVHAAQAFVDVAEHAARAADSYVAMTRKMYDHGLVSKSDRLRAEVNQGNVQLRLSTARSHLETARERLRILAGIDDKRLPETTDRVSVQMPTQSLDELKQAALEQNPGIAAMRHKLDASRAKIDVAQAQYLPNLNLMLRQEWNGESSLDGNASYTIGGQVTWNLLDFGARAGAVDKARAASQAAMADTRKAQEDLQLQVDRIWRQARLADERVRVQEKAVTQAREAERLERLRYQQGLSTLTQLLAAQAALDKARAELVAAHYQQVMQRAGLLLATGGLEREAFSVEPRAGEPACKDCFQ